MILNSNGPVHKQLNRATEAPKKVETMNESPEPSEASVASEITPKKRKSRKPKKDAE